MMIQEIEFVGSLGMPPTRYDEICRTVSTGTPEPAAVVSETIDLEGIDEKLEATTDFGTVGIPVVDPFRDAAAADPAVGVPAGRSSAPRSNVETTEPVSPGAARRRVRRCPPRRRSRPRARRAIASRRRFLHHHRGAVSCTRSGRLVSRACRSFAIFTASDGTRSRRPRHPGVLRAARL